MAGAFVTNNIKVTGVAGYGNAFGTAIDWAYESTNQTYGGGTKLILRAGKVVRGKSTINGKKNIWPDYSTRKNFC